MEKVKLATEKVKLATVWEIVSGEFKGKVVFESHTDDDLPAMMVKINMASVQAVEAILRPT